MGMTMTQKILAAHCGKDAVTAFEGERMANAVLAPTSATGIVRQMCGDSTATVPVAIASVQGKKYQSAKADWSNPTDVAANKGFPCLKFEMTAPQYYMYDYKGNVPSGGSANDDTFSATANGDLNGDGVAFSTFRVNGKIQEGRLTVAPALQEVSPEE